MDFLRRLGEDAIGVIFPEICVACGGKVVRGRRFLCTSCLYHLPRTYFHRYDDNPLAMEFWGRVRLEHAAAWFHYTKGSRYPVLIHALKYMGRRELGYELGRLYAHELDDTFVYETTVIVPVPLHRRKKRQRGYNQSEWIGRGLAQVLNKPLQTNNLCRVHYTKTQTRKSRLERWQNVKNVFRLRQPQLLEGQHVLLVDDVVTTGATLEACADVLLLCPGTRVSVLALGYANL